MEDAFGPDTRIGTLVVETELGRGAYATVYRARDARLDRTVALKVLKGRVFDTGAIDAFLGEARVIAGLNSPHVVTLYHLHERGAEGWILEMEYVAGGTLAGLIERGLSLDETERVLRGTLAGLGAAHARGVLHRDIKPANVLVGTDGAAKLSDFGLARVIGDDALARDEELVGTPLYMAPEVLLGGAASVQSDLWSVGIVAFQMLTGRLPFAAPNLPAFFFAVQNAASERLPPSVPPHLARLVQRCLEKDPAARPRTCAEALEALDLPVPARVREKPPVPPPTRLFGRRDEMDRLRALSDAVATGRAKVLLLTGDAGIGKSALLTEAVAAARGRGVRCLTCPLSSAEGPVHAVVHAARAMMLADQSWHSVNFGPAGAAVAKLLRGEASPELASRGHAVWTLEHLLRGVAADAPLLLCFEDAHEADDDDLALLAGLARACADLKVLVVVAARPEPRVGAKLAEVGPIERLALPGLPDESLYAYLDATAGAALPVDVVRRVADRSGGNPVVALELVRHLEATGGLVRKGDAFEAAPGWRDDSVPARLKDVVSARLATLDGDDRALLEVAAADGRTFDGRAVAAVSGEPTIRVLRRLQHLCHVPGLLEPCDDGYRFATAAAQEVVYEELASELRAELHRAFARHLEGREGPVDPNRLARHWERCGERARAVPYLLRVAEQAYGRQELHRVLDFAERAGLLADPPAVPLLEHVDFAISVASALRECGRGEDATRLLDRVEAEVGAAGDTGLAAVVEVRRASLEVHGGTRRVDEERLRRHAETLGESTWAGLARFMLGLTAKRRGDLAAAERELREADRIYTAVGDEWRHAKVLGQLGSVALRGRRYGEADALYRQAAELAYGVGRRGSAAVSQVNRVAAAMGHGRIDGLDRDLRRAIRTLELEGFPHQAAHARVSLAELLYALGDLKGALREVEAALPLLRRSRYPYSLSAAARFHGLALAVQGRLDSARAALAEAEAAATEAADRAMGATVLAIRAQAGCFAGRPDEAAADARAALGLVAADHDAMQDVLAYLAEATLYGLDPGILADAPAAGGSAVDAFVAGAIGFADPDGDPRKLRASAEAMRREPIGPRQAAFLLTADWLDIEAQHRAGDRTVARAHARRAHDAACALRHTYLADALARLATG